MIMQKLNWQVSWLGMRWRIASDSFVDFAHYYIIMFGRLFGPFPIIKDISYLFDVWNKKNSSNFCKYIENSFFIFLLYPYIKGISCLKNNYRIGFIKALGMFELIFLEIFIEKCIITIWYMWCKRIVEKCVHWKHKKISSENQNLNKIEKHNSHKSL